MEAFVEVHAFIVEDAFEQAALEDVSTADEEPLSPAVFETGNILVFGEGVGDEVTCEGDALLFGEVPIVGGGDTQLSGKLKLVGTLDDGPLKRAIGIEVGFERETVA